MVKKKQNIFLRCLKFFLLFLLISIFILTIGITVFIFVTIRSAPDIDVDEIAPKQEATYIYDIHNERQQKLTTETANREITTLANIPLDMQHAFVAIEDVRFYQHKGIDPIGIIRAFVQGIIHRRFNEGASTITQQLLKNNVFTNWTEEKTFMQRLKRKIQEQYLAVKLEKDISKDRIMENYLNTINLGEGCYGVQSASYRYFGKDVSKLSLAEIAVIAGITQNPSLYNPITYPENNAIKQKIVLQKMVECNFITQEQMDKALKEPVYENIQTVKLQNDSNPSVYTFYEDALITQVIEDLMTTKNYTRNQAYKLVYGGGLRIYSAQDPEIQTVCDEEFADESNFPETIKYGLDYALSVETKTGKITHYSNDDLTKWLKAVEHISYSLMSDNTDEIYQYTEMFKNAIVTPTDTVLGERISITPQPQASMIIIDQSTGYVKALIGGRGEKEASLTLNRATQTTRQPGSTFKILTTFAPAIEELNHSLATTYESTEYYYDDGDRVNNWNQPDNEEPITMREAIIRSINTAAVDCITQLTPKVGYEYAEKFGITTLVKSYDNGQRILSDEIQPLALGGIIKGTTVMEICAAYAAIANQGTYITPKFYTKVLDAKGNILLEAQTAKKQVISPETAYQMTNAMQDVIKSQHGTAHNYIDMGEMPVAGKTGTTDDYRDIWFAGYTPYFTCCIWGGYDNNHVLPDENESVDHNYDLILWNKIMNRIHQGRKTDAFPKPDAIITKKICSETHLLANEFCENTYDEIFTKQNIPKECDLHKEITITEDKPETKIETLTDE